MHTLTHLYDSVQALLRDGKARQAGQEIVAHQYTQQDDVIQHAVHIHTRRLEQQMKAEVAFINNSE